jgi:type I restriction enzyme S subunit
MTNKWQQTKLIDYCDIVNGKTPLRSNPSYWTDGEINWFTIDDMRRQGRFISDTAQHITDIAQKESGLKLVPKDSVLVCCTASVGEVAYSLTNLTTNQQFNALIPKDRGLLDSVFLYYAVDYISPELTKQMGTTTFGFVSISKLGNLKIPFPRVKTQQKIASILSSVDDAIQKTDQIIQETEKLKQGLMNELLTKGIGHKKFKKTKLGELPEVWKIKKLEEIASVNRGKFSHRPRNDARFYNGNIPFIQTGDVVNSRGRIKSFTQTLNEKGLGVSRMFPKGTIVMTIAANIGDTGILEFDSCFPDSLVGIQPNSEVNNIYLEYFLRSRKPYLNSIATQSAQKNINLQKLNPLLVALPPLAEQRKIAEILSSIDEKIEKELAEKEKLNSLKRGLMQDIFSQKVEVN